MIEGLHWLGHAGFRIDGEATVYVDPYRVLSAVPGDVICISHEHYDHCSPRLVERLRAHDSVIVAPRSCAGKFKGDVRVLEAGGSVSAKGIVVEAIPAYNIRKPFHPRSAGGLGFIITARGRRIYHAGDTDLIPEMAAVRAEVALLPVSGGYVMSADEAAEAARRIRPAVAVPMHYGSIAGTRADALRFKELSCVPAEILERE